MMEIIWIILVFILDDSPIISKIFRLPLSRRSLCSCQEYVFNHLQITATSEFHMKKQKMILVPAASLLCFLLISGCTQHTPSPVKVTIQDILVRAKNIGPIKYDVVTSFTVNGSTMPNRTKTIWEEPPYTKVELLLGNTSAVFITRPDGFYVRNPGEHNFTKTTSHSSDQPLENQSAELLTNISFQVVGNETINGNATTVLQYTTNESGSPSTVKVWIWNDKGIPVKSQTTVFMGKTAFITVIMYEHFVFGDISLSEFSVS